MVNSRLYIPHEIRLVDDRECLWVENNFSVGRKLMEEEKRFRTAVNSLWDYRMNVNPFVQMSVLWAGIESLIGIGNGELSYRISTTAALFLESGIEGRKRIKKLYNARSKAVHEGFVKSKNDVDDSAVLLRNLLVKCVETVSLPNEENLIYGYVANE